MPFSLQSSSQNLSAVQLKGNTCSSSFVSSPLASIKSTPMFSLLA